MYRVLTECRLAFSTFGDLTTRLKRIECQPSRNQKIRLFKQYISELQNHERRTVKSIFQLAFVRFSRLDDKTLANQSQSLTIPSSKLELYLYNQNDVLNAIADLYVPPHSSQQLKLKDVLQEFQSIRQSIGKNSRQLRIVKLQRLLSRCQSRDQRRLILSLLTGNLQMGFQKTSIQRIFHQLVPQEKQCDQHKYKFMLTKPLKDFDQAIKFINNSSVSVEYKFDGQRTHVQYHRDHPIRLFSRNGKSQLDKYGDMASKAQSDLNSIPQLQSCILDGEIICVDSNGKVTPIQILLNRKGKSRLNLNDQYVEKVMVFDILEKDGRSLIDTPYLQRIQHIPNLNDHHLFANVQRRVFILPNQQQQWKQYFQQVVASGYQGLILKKIDSPYDINGGRTHWAKLKKGDTSQGTTGRTVDVDLILMGAFRGKGNRKGIFGSYLFGVLYNGKVYPITKTGTALTKKQFQSVSDQVMQYIVSEVPSQYEIPKKMPKPDIWIKPHFVVEISSQEWTRSPVYQFDQNSQGGLSLRFPRFIRIRDDKSIIDSTKGEEILQLIK